MRSPGASACASWNAWPGGSLSNHVGSLTTSILPFCEEAQANHVNRLCGERAIRLAPSCSTWLSSDTKYVREEVFTQLQIPETT